jgi:hypothetical protein
MEPTTNPDAKYVQMAVKLRKENWSAVDLHYYFFRLIGAPERIKGILEQSRLKHEKDLASGVLLPR